MVRVLHIVESLAAGGAERVVAEYARVHDRDRYAPEVCCVRSAGPLLADLEKARVPVHVLGRRFRLDPRPFIRLARVLRRGRYDVIHNHNFAALSVGFPVSIVTGSRAMVRTEHNVIRSGLWVRQLLSRTAALREDAQIAVSSAGRRAHIEAGRIPAGRFVTVRNGIGNERLAVRRERAAVRRELGIEEDAFVCLNVGSLTRQKNRRNLIDAIARLGDVEKLRVLIVGSGPEEAALKRYSAESGVGDRVRFLGQRMDVGDLLGASDLFVLSSDWEGLPITVLEAMATGLPCVATDVGGVSEAVTDGVTGLVAPPGDAEALADGLRALAGDADLRARMAESAREDHERRFTAEGMVRQTEALYSLALSGHAALAVSSRIKVLYVIGQLDRGGAERQTAELVKRIPRDLFEPVVCCLSKPGPIGDEMEDEGIRVVYLEKSRGLMSGATRRLAGLIRRERPVIVHSYLFSANWRSLLAGRLTRVPLIISSVRNVDIHTRMSTQVAEWVVSGLTDRVIANAEAVKSYVSRHHHIASEKIHVIYNGVSLRRARVPKSADPMEQSFGAKGSDTRSPQEPATSAPLPGAKEAPGRVGMIASLTSKKDHGTFLRAAQRVLKRMPGVRFSVIGDGPLRAAVSDSIHAMGLSDAVTLMGSRDDIGELLSGIEVTVLSSLKEGCSNVVLESMAAGRPVVVTNVGGNSELVEDGEQGFLVPVGDDEKMAERIVELLADAALRRRMGEAGRTRVESLYTADRMARRTVDFYLSALDKRTPGLHEWVTLARARGEKPTGAKADGGTNRSGDDSISGRGGRSDG